MSKHRFILQPYRGIGTRHQCPNCGHKQELTLYIDTETGNPVHPSVGKCNRESKCGYHYSPSDFFKDNPDMKPSDDWKPVYEPPRPKEEKAVFIPAKFIPSGKGLEDNNLFKFFVSAFGEGKARDVFAKYHVGTSKHFRNDGGMATAFPQMDASGNLRQIKVIAYNPATGKRLHKEHQAERHTSKGYVIDTNMDKVWFAGKSLLGNYEANLRQCFFGEHLIQSSEKVAIVESEKTAMIASLYLPSFAWIATGGKNGCKWHNQDVCEVLSGKTVFLYPDLKCLQEWTEKAEMLKGYGLNIHVSKYLEESANDEEKDKGLDIGDFLIKEPLPSGLHTEEPGRRLKDVHPLHTIGEILEYAKSIGVDNRITIIV